MQTSGEDILNPNCPTLRIIRKIRQEPLNEKYLQDWVLRTVKKNDDDEDDEINFQYTFTHGKNKKKIKRQHAVEMKRLRILFSCQRHFRQICEDIDNKFVTSSFTTYIADCRYMKNYNDSVNKWHDKPNDLKYIIDLFGSKLTCLCLEKYQFSGIMPFINNNCPNLKQLRLKFKEIKSEDFENVFSNMSNLKGLGIKWECDSTLPDTLVNSLEQVGGTLKYLNFQSHLGKNKIFLPDSLTSVFPQLIALKELHISKLGLEQSLLESIGEMTNLVKFDLNLGSLDTHPVFHENINMHPIGNLKTLKSLNIKSDCGVTDEFLINLCNNAKKLREIHVVSTKLTDNGMMALNNLKKLKTFYLRLPIFLENNKISHFQFITDASIQYLYNKELKTLMLTNCINITNKSVIELVKNLPNLQVLCVANTSVTFNVVEEIPRSTEYREKKLLIFVSFEDHTGAVDRLFKSFNIHFI